MLECLRRNTMEQDHPLRWQDRLSTWDSFMRRKRRPKSVSRILVSFAWGRFQREEITSWLWDSWDTSMSFVSPILETQQSIEYLFRYLMDISKFSMNQLKVRLEQSLIHLLSFTKEFWSKSFQLHKSSTILLT